MLLIVQSKGKHRENLRYRECECLERAFTRLGVKTQVTGMGYESFECWDELIAYASSVLVLENYGMLQWLPKSFRHVGVPKVFWCIDSHVALKRHLRECDTYQFDQVLCSVGAHVDKFGDNALWMPNAYPADLIRPNTDITKRHDVGFCGNWVTGRRDFYERVAKRVPIHTDIMVLGDSMVRAIQRYRVHLNRNYSVDLNYRTYETLGAGTFLLTNKTDRLMDLFKPGTHLDTYDSADDCVEKIHHYLKHTEERELIAHQGAQMVRDQHSYDSRARWMLKRGVVR